MRSLPLLIALVFVAACDRPAPSPAPMAGVTLPRTDVKNLIHALGCTNCHDMRNPLVGPPFDAVTARYRESPDGAATLAASMRNGSSGKWGLKVPDMPPQRVSVEESELIASFLLRRESAAAGQPARRP
jgi:cytochrome c551/c552